MIVKQISDSPAAFVQQIVLPQRRPGARNVRLVGQEDLPEWANSIAAANQQPG